MQIRIAIINWRIVRLCCNYKIAFDIPDFASIMWWQCEEDQGDGEAIQELI